MGIILPKLVPALILVYLGVDLLLDSFERLQLPHQRISRDQLDIPARTLEMVRQEQARMKVTITLMRWSITDPDQAVVIMYIMLIVMRIDLIRDIVIRRVDTAMDTGGSTESSQKWKSWRRS
jgi:hypothetical protein